MGKLIIKLDDASYLKIDLVGGKAASLGEMLRAGINVPPGFVVTTEAFHAGMSKRLKTEIIEAFDELGQDRVAVRSSAVAEDSQSASWAGQLESYLNITQDNLIEAIENCWKSMKTERAENYAEEHNIGESERSVAVVVQAMVDSEVSGVMFTANPVTKEKKEIMIESVHGLCELLVQGEVIPELVIVSRSTGELLQREISKQRELLVHENEVNRKLEVPSHKFGKEILTAVDIAKLLQLAVQIEELYKNVPQDIEWAMHSSRLYVVQSRPIT